MALVGDLSPRRQSKAVEKVGGDAGDMLRREAMKEVVSAVVNSAGRGRKQRKFDNLPNVRLSKERKLARRK